MLLPAYNEIPDVGLYLDQVTKYLNTYLDSESALTPTMVTNYVKLKIVPKAIKKAYSRKQIMMFFFIAFAKPVLSMDQIRKVFNVRPDIERLYCSFRDVLSGEESDDDLIFAIATAVLRKTELDQQIAEAE